MEHQDIITNFLTSTFIVGLATYFIRKRIDKRFNKIEEFQKSLITIRKERYDTLLKTLHDIWGKLVETEYYIRFDLGEQIKYAQKTQLDELIFDSKPLKDAFIFIEKRSILLDYNLSNKTRDLFIKYLQSTYNGYIDIIRQAITKEKTLTEVNSFIPNSLGETYRKELEGLRKEFEKQARDILYENK